MVKTRAQLRANRTNTVPVETQQNLSRKRKNSKNTIAPVAISTNENRNDNTIVLDPVSNANNNNIVMSNSSNIDNNLSGTPPSNNSLSADMATREFVASNGHERVDPNYIPNGEQIDITEEKQQVMNSTQQTPQTNTQNASNSMHSSPYAIPINKPLEAYRSLLTNEIIPEGGIPLTPLTRNYHPSVDNLPTRNIMTTNGTTGTTGAQNTLNSRTRRAHGTHNVLENNLTRHSITASERNVNIERNSDNLSSTVNTQHHQNTMGREQRNASVDRQMNHIIHSTLSNDNNNSSSIRNPTNTHSPIVNLNESLNRSDGFSQAQMVQILKQNNEMMMEKMFKLQLQQEQQRQPPVQMDQRTHQERNLHVQPVPVGNNLPISNHIHPRTSHNQQMQQSTPVVRSLPPGTDIVFLDEKLQTSPASETSRVVNDMKKISAPRFNYASNQSVMNQLQIMLGYPPRNRGPTIVKNLKKRFIQGTFIKHAPKHAFSLEQTLLRRRSDVQLCEVTSLLYCLIERLGVNELLPKVEYNIACEALACLIHALQAKRVAEYGSHAEARTTLTNYLKQWPMEEVDVITSTRGRTNNNYSEAHNDIILAMGKILQMGEQSTTGNGSSSSSFLS